MPEKLFKKKRMERRFITNTNAAHEFRYAMEFAQQVLTEETKEDKIIILDFMLDVIKEDLKNDLLTTIFYSEENFKKRMPLPFPLYFYDEYGVKYELFSSGKKRLRRVDLAKDCVLVLPWNRKRIRDSIKNIFATEFKFDELNHKAYYFSPVNICYVYNGNHSIASGVVYKKGYITAEECDVSRLFDHVYTDGLCWYNSHNNEKLDDMFDFRIGIIYELSKLKYKEVQN